MQPLASLDDARQFGALFTGHSTIGRRVKLRFEAPVRFYGLDCSGEGLTMGAYSFMRAAFVSGNAVIGRYCSIGANFSMGEPDHPLQWLSTSSVQYHAAKYAFYEPMAAFEGRPPVETTQQTRIGNDVWIGSNVMVLRGVKIGDGAVIAAGAVVTSDVAPYTIVGGVPAKMIRNRFPNPSLPTRLMKLKWWEFLAPDLSGILFDDVPNAIQEITRREAAGEILRRKPRYNVIRWGANSLCIVPPKDDAIVEKSADGTGS